MKFPLAETRILVVHLLGETLLFFIDNSPFSIYLMPDEFVDLGYQHLISHIQIRRGEEILIEFRIGGMDGRGSSANFWGFNMKTPFLPDFLHEAEGSRSNLRDQPPDSLEYLLAENLEEGDEVEIFWNRGATLKERDLRVGR